TTAPMGPFQRERVRDSHHAIGVPMSSNSSVVSVANCRVSQIAAKSEESRCMQRHVKGRTYGAATSQPNDLITPAALALFRKSTNARTAGLLAPRARITASCLMGSCKLGGTIQADPAVSLPSL